MQAIKNKRPGRTVRSVARRDVKRSILAGDCRQGGVSVRFDGARIDVGALLEERQPLS